MKPSARFHVFGMGYVGTVTALSLLDGGHQVTGVEVDKDRVAESTKGQFRKSERNIKSFYETLVARGSDWKVRANLSQEDVADVMVICVGTGSEDLRQEELKSVLATVAEDIKRSRSRQPLVMVRSTVPAGTLRKVIAPKLEEFTNLREGVDFHVVFFPEFLREGSALDDLRSPAFFLVGILGDCLPEKQIGRIEAMWKVDCPLSVRRAEEVEMIKMASNAFHALKITFTNEISALCVAMGIDSSNVMSEFQKDKKLNISAAYLNPGFSFGGPCLEKDTACLVRLSKEVNLKAPLLEGIFVSNERLLKQAIDFVKERRFRTIGVCGLVFKPGAEDFRGSAMVRLVEGLLENAEIDKILIFEELDHPNLRQLAGDRIRWIGEPRSLLEADLIVLGTRELETAVLEDFGRGHRQPTILDLRYFPKRAQALKKIPGYVCLT